jgi:hypothetical protein
VALVHATAASELAVDPALTGTATAVHADPFQRIASGPGVVPDFPTAQHVADASGHETPSRRLPPGAEIATWAQLVPFQRSVSIALPARPIAKQWVALAHETDVSAEEAGDGAVETVHEDPLNLVMNVPEPDADEREPTAKQLVGVAHDTPERIESTFPAGVGTFCTDHPDGFQRRAIVRRKPFAADEVPTATQLVADAHEIPLR